MAKNVEICMTNPAVVHEWVDSIFMFETEVKDVTATAALTAARRNLIGASEVKN